MGTRTWSRKGVLTAAGRRRQASGAGGGVNAAIYDIFGDVIGDDGLSDGSAPQVAPALAPAPVVAPPPAPPVAAVAPAPVPAPKPARVAPVTPPQPKLFDKRERGAPVPFTSKGVDDPKSEISQAFVAAGLKLIKNPKTQITPAGQRLLQQKPPMSMRDMLANLNVFDAMSVIYEMRGWNATPEVDTWNNISKRTDIVQTEGGNPLLFLRSVDASSGRTTAKISALQKMKDLRQGIEHFVGRGVFGQGTYAAANDFNDAGKPKSWIQSLSDAWGASRQYGKTTVIMALKKGSNIRTRKDITPGKPDDLKDEASKRMGLKINDTGLAAALLGYDAYRCGGRNGGSYWVILNRGATIMSKEQTAATKSSNYNTNPTVF
jgi:hypothetical protein